jgi:chromosome segregation ATPase
MLGKNKNADASAALRDRLADLDRQISDASIRRSETRLQLATCRAAALAASSPAAGPFAVRAPRHAAAVATVRAAEAADRAAGDAEHSLRAERDQVQAELVQHEAAQQASRSDGELRRALADAEQTLDQRRKELESAADVARKAQSAEWGAADEAARLWRATGPTAEQRAQAHRTANERTEAARTAFAAVGERRRQVEQARERVDGLVGLLDRRQRQWKPPQPASVPALPDNSMADSERAEALAALLPALRARQSRAQDRLAEAGRTRDEARIGNAAIPPGARQARFEDAEADFQQRLRDVGALDAAIFECDRQLRRLERQAVA